MIFGDTVSTFGTFKRWSFGESCIANWRTEAYLKTTGAACDPWHRRCCGVGWIFWSWREWNDLNTLNEYILKMVPFMQIVWDMILYTYTCWIGWEFLSRRWTKKKFKLFLPLSSQRVNVVPLEIWWSKTNLSIEAPWAARFCIISLGQGAIPNQASEIMNHDAVHCDSHDKHVYHLTLSEY